MVNSLLPLPLPPLPLLLPKASAVQSFALSANPEQLPRKWSTISRVPATRFLAPLFQQGQKSHCGHNKARLWNLSGPQRSPDGKTVWRPDSNQTERPTNRNGSCSHSTDVPVLSVQHVRYQPLRNWVIPQWPLKGERKPNPKNMRSSGKCLLCFSSS